MDAVAGRRRMPSRPRRQNPWPARRPKPWPPRRRMHSAVMLALAVLVLVAGCSASAPSPVVESTSTTLPAADRARLLGAAALARVAVDNSFGGKDVFDHVDVVERLGAATPSGFVTEDPSAVAMSAPERAAIQEALAPRAVTWVPSWEHVTGTGSIPTPEPGRALLWLAAPVMEAGGATVTSALWCGGTCGAGGAQLLKQDESGAWRFAGPEGPQWVA